MQRKSDAHEPWPRRGTEASAGATRVLTLIQRQRDMGRTRPLYSFLPLLETMACDVIDPARRQRRDRAIGRFP